MRVLAAVLGLALILLQYRLWLSDQGVREVSRLQASIDAQASANREQSERNRQLAAEVTDLKVGLAALEERARSELGMVGNNETFYQVVTAATPAPAAPAPVVTARAESSAARRVWAIVPAAGRGARFAASSEASIPKQYAPLLGATVLEWSLRALLAEPRVHAVMVGLAADDARWPGIAARLGSAKLHSTVGGANRQDTVANALDALAGQAAADDWILVHDAARPCLSAGDLGALLDAAGASNRDGAVLAAPIVDTVKRELGDRLATVDRQGLWRALTPQVFAFAPLRHALHEAKLAGVEVTDEAQAVERMGLRPALVPGSPFNVKVTRPQDLATAAGILKMTEVTPMRVGQGFDVHAFGEGGHVILGGVRIAHAKGVVAHSDGDVVIHALCDAILGALGDGDIGQHFPDSDPQYRGADSRVFLRVVAARMQAAGLRLINADVTVLAEAPRIAAHRDAMAANLCADLGVAQQLINIKATTTERLGFIGRGEGLAALASVLLGP